MHNVSDRAIIIIIIIITVVVVHLNYSVGVHAAVCALYNMKIQGQGPVFFIFQAQFSSFSTIQSVKRSISALEHDTKLKFSYYVHLYL